MTYTQTHTLGKSFLTGGLVLLNGSSSSPLSPSAAHKGLSVLNWIYFFFLNLKTCLQVPLTIITGPVQRCVPAVVSQRGQGWRLRAGNAQQLTQPGSVASGSGQVDGCTTARVAEQNRSLLLQQTLDALLLTTQQLRQQSRSYIRIYNTNLKEHFLFVSFYKSSNE